MAPSTRANSDQKGQPKQNQPEVSSRSTANSSQVTEKTETVAPEPREQGETVSRALKRDQKAAEDFAAVNGIVIPSKVPPGASPNQGFWIAKEFNVHACSICARRFARKSQVKSHLSACVARNGNPNGARWDDVWRHEDQDVGTDSDETESNQSYAGLTADMLADQSLSDISPYNSALRFDVLTNEALLEMVEGWQKIIRQMGKDYAVAHAHYQAVWDELILRGMVDPAGNWLVDPEKVDVKFVRVG